MCLAGDDRWPAMAAMLDCMIMEAMGCGAFARKFTKRGNFNEDHPENVSVVPHYLLV